MLDPLNNFHLNLPSPRDWISSAGKALFSEVAESGSTFTQPFLPENLPSFFRNPLEPLEGYLGRLRPGGSPSLEKNVGAPFVLFVGIAALAHGLLGWGAYEISEYDSLENQAEQRREKLIDQAREALEKRRSDPNYHPDLTDFLIATETLGKNPRTDSENELQIKQVREKFSGYRENLSPYKNPVEQTYFLASQLYYDSFFHYAAAYPNLKNFLEHKKGNCVAQTKMFLAAFSQSGISLPKDYDIGVQVFKNHVQAVLYHQDSSGKIHWVQNLISGKKQNEVIASIYQPAIVLAGFLKKVGEATPMEFEDLLIARPAGQREEAGFNGEEAEYIESQPIAWPNSGVLFDGEAPEDGILEPPVFEEEEGDRKEPPSSGISAGALGRKDLVSLAANPQSLESFEYRLFSEGPDDVKTGWLDFRVEVIQIPPASSDPSAPSGKKIVTYFRSTQQRDQYSRLFTPAEKREFLFKLVQGSLRRVEESPPFKSAEHIFKNPLKNIPEFENSGNELWNLLNRGGNFGEFWKGLNLLGLPPLEHWKLSRKEKEKIFSDLPRWQALHRNLLAFRKLIQENPKDLLLMVNQIKTPKERYSFFQSLETLREYFGGEETDIFLNLHQWIIDPDKVGVTGNKDLETPFVPPAFPEDWIEVELTGAGSPGDLSEPHPKSSTTLNAIPTETGEPIIRISPQTMIDLLLHSPRPMVPEGKVLEYKYWDRWNEALSSALLERDTQSIFDKIFYLKPMTQYWVLKNLEQTESDPWRAQHWRAWYDPNRPGPPSHPKELESLLSEFNQIMESAQWKRRIPRHFIPVMKRAEKMVQPGVALFRDQEPGPSEENPPAPAP